MQKLFSVVHKIDTMFHSSWGTNDNVITKLFCRHDLNTASSSQVLLVPAHPLGLFSILY